MESHQDPSRGGSPEQNDFDLDDEDWYRENFEDYHNEEHFEQDYEDMGQDYDNDYVRFMVRILSPYNIRNASQDQFFGSGDAYGERLRIPVRFLSQQSNSEFRERYKYMFCVLGLDGKLIELHTRDKSCALSTAKQFMEGDELTLTVLESYLQYKVDTNYTQAKYVISKNWSLSFDNTSRQGSNSSPKHIFCWTNIESFHKSKMRIIRPAGSVLAKFLGCQAGPRTSAIKSIFVFCKDEVGKIFRVLVWRTINDHIEFPFPICDDYPTVNTPVLFLNVREMDEKYRRPDMFGLVTSTIPIVEPLCIDPQTYDKLVRSGAKLAGNYCPYQTVNLKCSSQDVTSFKTT